MDAVYETVERLETKWLSIFFECVFLLKECIAKVLPIKKQSGFRYFLNVFYSISCKLIYNILISNYSLNLKECINTT